RGAADGHRSSRDYDAISGIERHYEPFLVAKTPPKGCSLEAAISAAAHQALRTLFPKSASAFDSHYRAILSVIPDTLAKTNGLDWGKHVASELLKLRQFDGAGQSVAFMEEARPGYWQRTPPNYDKPLLPNLGKMKAF